MTDTVKYYEMDSTFEHHIIGSKSIKMRRKLTTRMRKTLMAVASSGGEAHYLGGGWWSDVDGRQLQCRIDRWGEMTDVVTQTILALEQRGLLERMHADNRYSRDSRRVTETGLKLISDH